MAPPAIAEDCAGAASLVGLAPASVVLELTGGSRTVPLNPARQKSFDTPVRIAARGASWASLT